MRYSKQKNLYAIKWFKLNNVFFFFLFAWSTLFCKATFLFSGMHVNINQSWNWQYVNLKLTSIIILCCGPDGELSNFGLQVGYSASVSCDEDLLALCMNPSEQRNLKIFYFYFYYNLAIRKNLNFS